MKIAHALRIQHIQEDLQQRLQWDELQYNEFMFNAGIDYLQNYLPGEDDIIKEITHSRHFWNWWKRHWHRRDEQFYRAWQPNWSTEDCRYIYKDMHNPAILARRIYPNGIVLSESYAAMMGNLIDNLYNAAI